MSAEKPTSRRVLGDKTPNTSLQTHNLIGELDAHKNTLAVMISDNVLTKTAPVPELAEILAGVGRKRRFYQLDGGNDDEEPQVRRLSTSPLTNAFTGSQDGGLVSHSMATTESDSQKPFTLGASSSVSQDETAPFESEFDIFEDMSQKTADNVVSLTNKWDYLQYA